MATAVLVLLIIAFFAACPAYAAETHPEFTERPHPADWARRDLGPHPPA